MSNSNTRLRLLKMPFFAPLLFLVQSLSAQKDTTHLSFMEPTTKGVYSAPCGKKSHLSFASRIKHYPFNLSAQIQMISFEGFVKITDNGEFNIFGANTIMFNGLDSIGIRVAEMKEIRTLTLQQIDSLTDILYNYGIIEKLLYRNSIGARVMSWSASGCYEPRNAILFRDAGGRVMAFIEICFKCQNSRESSPKISLGEMCEQKLDMLKALFRQTGIKYGIEPDKRVE